MNCIHQPEFPADVAVDEMDFAELDRLRADLRLSQAQLCRRCDLNEATYTRWRRWLRGEPGCGPPRARSLRPVREVLKLELQRIARHLPAATRAA